ncbi:tetratricopeptide repeat protein [Cerasicoccus frondis]|uniref:tetratricopeptide repeat protein n=1 Tax=Cerasicoccus frondis TaxID=490090 RepID=UPI002852B2AA|nr:tetratricopeptide repeat protein [Cerasicoccus frondis]
MSERNYREVIPYADRLIAFGPDRQRAQKLRLRALVLMDPERANREVMALLLEEDVRDYPQISMGMLEYLVDAEQFEPAYALSKRMEESMSADPDFQLLMAKIAISRKDFDRALRSIDSLTTMNPNSAEGHFLRAQILLDSDNRAARIQAKASLRQVASLQDPLSFEALVLLATTPDLPMFDSDREWLIRQLSDPRSSTATKRLLADSQRIIMQPLMRVGVIRDAVKREGKDEPELLVQWLIGQQAYEALGAYLHSSNGQNVMQGGDWNMDLLATMGRDPECVRYLTADSDLPMDEVSRSMLLAYASASMAPRQLEPSEPWLAAFELATAQEDAEALEALGALALQQGWSQEAEEATVAAIETYSSSDDKLRLIPSALLFLEKNGNTQKMLELTNLALRFEPANISMVNNRVYLQALLQGPNEKDIEKLKTMLDQGGPNALNSALAFCLYQQGKTDEAEKFYARLDPKFYQVPSCRLLGMLIAKAQGDTDIAQKFMQGLQVNDLLPEELELYQAAKLSLTTKQE